MEINVSGMRTNVQITGNGEPVLLLHGWGAQIESFAPVIFALEKYRRVVALDLPGFGKSGFPEEAWTVDDYMEFVLSFMQAVDLKKADILCHSFGGRIAILLAAKHPEMAGRIVFVDSAGVRPRRTLRYYAKVYSYKLAKRIAKHKGISSFFKAVGLDAEKKFKNAGSTDYKNLPECMKKTFVNVVNEDLSIYLKDIKSPSLLIWGADDADTPLWQAQKMEREIPDAGLVVLEDAGHYSYLDQFPRFIAVVNNFFGGE